MKQHHTHYAVPYVYTNRDRVELVVPPIKRMKLFTPYIREGDRVLELGCGKGLLGEQIQMSTEALVYGVDISPSGIQLAKKRGVLAKVADLNKRLPFNNGYFDVIVSDQLFEHVYKTDHLLSEIFRILKPGGIVVTVTPNLSFWLNRIFFMFGIYPVFLETGELSKTYGMRWLKKNIADSKPQGHIHVFNKSALEDIFVAHGFTISRVFGSPFPWQLPKLTLIAYNAVDKLFAHWSGLARDIVLIATKHT